MPQSGFWRKKLLAIKSAPWQRDATFGCRRYRKTGRCRDLEFPLSQGIGFPHVGADALPRIREA
jgi:hypothetical protein